MKKILIVAAIVAISFFYDTNRAYAADCGETSTPGYNCWGCGSTSWGKSGCEFNFCESCVRLDDGFFSPMSCESFPVHNNLCDVMC